MAFSPLTIGCLIVAAVWVAASSPVVERSSERNVKVLQLNEAQSKQAVESVIAVLQGVSSKLKEAEAGISRRSAEETGLQVTVDAADSLDLSADDVVSYLQDVAYQVNGVADHAVVERGTWNRTVTGGVTRGRGGYKGKLGLNLNKNNHNWDFGLDYSKPGGLGGSVGYTYKKGNTAFNANVGYSPGGGWGGGLGFSFSF
ncbi:hypothetical protein BaRGS_00009747 [Batillaria attramentaria]|uniref:Uncharacterized protein n=1 Tax=Batillaria attramentaria TaxID=370345 RepID=A0ABD0LHP1_9CAEN